MQEKQPQPIALFPDDVTVYGMKYFQWDWLAALTHEDVWKFCTTESGELCAMTISLTQQQVLSAGCSELGIAQW